MLNTVSPTLVNCSSVLSFGQAQHCCPEVANKVQELASSGSQSVFDELEQQGQIVKQGPSKKKPALFLLDMVISFFAGVGVTTLYRNRQEQQQTKQAVIPSVNKEAANA